MSRFRTATVTTLLLVPIVAGGFLLQEKPRVCNAIILDFLTSEPVQTVAPIRRAP